jgi:hypothetical protein
VGPFGMMALEDAPESHRLRSEIYAKHTFKQTPLPLAPKPPQRPKRLRIGYFSADFQNHPVMYALIEVLEQHNRALFEVYAYSFGPDNNSEMRQRVIKAVDVFDNVKDMDDQTVALLARQDKIDIAIDLTGYTKNGRAGVLLIEQHLCRSLCWVILAPRARVSLIILLLIKLGFQLKIRNFFRKHQSICHTPNALLKLAYLFWISLPHALN